MPATADLNLTDLAQTCVFAVDDNLATLRLVSEILRGGGVGQVYTFDNAIDAMRALNELRPDILFVDWQMPGMDGLALTKAIRAAARCPDPAVPNPEVPIIMLTGRRREKDVEHARLAGVTEFVAKPFAPSALMARVHAVTVQARDFVISAHYIGPDRRRRRSEAYAGPFRRASDNELTANSDLRAETRRTIGVELDAIRKLSKVRGAFDGDTAQLAYRSMLHNIHRARAIRDTAIEQASNSLVRYIDAVGGPQAADPKLIQVHMDALGKLLVLGDGSRAAALVNERLNVAVARKLSKTSLPR